MQLCYTDEAEIHEGIENNVEKKGVAILLLLFGLFLFLSACNNSDEAKYVYWTGETENQIERLEKAKVF